MHVGWNCDSRLHRHSYKLLSVLQPERAVEKGRRFAREGALGSIFGSDWGLLVLTGQPVSQGHTPQRWVFITPVAIFCSVDTVQWVRARGPWVPLPDPSVTVMSLFVG